MHIEVFGTNREFQADPHRKLADVYVRDGSVSIDCHAPAEEKIIRRLFSGSVTEFIPAGEGADGVIEHEAGSREAMIYLRDSKLRGYGMAAIIHEERHDEHLLS